MNGDLSPELVNVYLGTRWLGRTLHFFPVVASTNEVLYELALAGAPAGSMVLADFQTAGKGRLGRRWEAPAGTSLLFSLLFRPGWPAAQAAWLTMMAGLATAEAVAGLTGVVVGLKWPNDVMIHTADGWRKVGGLLLAGDVTGERVELALMGIGLNVNMLAAELPAEVATPATSLRLASGQPVARAALLGRLLGRLERLYEAAERGESPRPGWEARLITRHQPVRVTQGGQTLEGVAVGTDEWGQLLVRDGLGVLHTIPAGDVTLRGDG